MRSASRAIHRRVCFYCASHAFQPQGCRIARVGGSEIQVCVRSGHLHRRVCRNSLRRSVTQRLLDIGNQLPNQPAAAAAPSPNLAARNALRRHSTVDILLPGRPSCRPAPPIPRPISPNRAVQLTSKFDPPRCRQRPAGTRRLTVT